MSTTGSSLARGLCRYLTQAYAMAPVCELVPTRGLRVDVMALSKTGEIWIIECKSCRADFRSDRKWTGYLPWCDRFFWAVDSAFPQEILPNDTGLFVADRHGAALIRDAALHKLPAARRKALTLKFAHHAAARAQAALDPGARALSVL